MANPKQYFHDHLVLVLLSVSAVLAVGTIIFVLVQLLTGHSASYIVQCRDCSNPNAINKFSTGSVFNLLGFVFFAALILGSQIALSLRAYRIHRQVAIALLSLGVLLLLLNLIISNALLVLR